MRHPSQSRKTFHSEDGRVEMATESLTSVIDQLLAAGLQLVRATRDSSAESAVRAGLRRAIEDLDTAITELRNAAVVLYPADATDPKRGATPRTDSRSRGESSLVAVANPPTGRLLRRVGETDVFAYAPRDGRFFRASDDGLWAREQDGMLLATRSGATLAVRVGNVYYHPQSNEPLYTEDG